MAGARRVVELIRSRELSHRYPPSLDSCGRLLLSYIVLPFFRASTECFFSLVDC